MGELGGRVAFRLMKGLGHVSAPQSPVPPAFRGCVCSHTALGRHAPSLRASCSRRLPSGWGADLPF